MSERIAKTHHNKSNRAKTQDTSDRKVVYKSVLDNPFRIAWPNVPLNIQNCFQARVITLLEGVAEYQLSHQDAQRKRKRAQKAAKPQKSSKRFHDAQEGQTGTDTAMIAPAVDTAGTEEVSTIAEEAPDVLQNVIVGINAVTKDLECLAKASRETLNSDPSGSPKPRHDLSSRLVLVCRADVDPPVLIGHLPNLVAACNSSRHHLDPKPVVWLVPLPKDAESSLAVALGLRRVSVITVKSSVTGFSDFETMLGSIPILSASWLNAPESAQSNKPTLVPTHIKQLRTTAPKDMKAAKERRNRQRGFAKEHKSTLAKELKSKQRIIRKNGAKLKREKI